MPATLARLVEIRSQLVEYALLYFERMLADATRLPAYFPEHLRIAESGKTPFDDIRQVVQVVDRKAHEDWLREHEAGLREQARAAGLEDPRIYAPKRSRVEASGGESEREPRSEVPKPPPPPVIWDERAGERFKRAVILGDPGFGKTWLLRFEARRLARAAKQGLIEHTHGVDEIIVPIFMRLSDLNRALAGDKTLAEALLPSRRSEYPALFLNWLKGAIEGCRCVLLLDAFDEVKADQRQALRERLAELLNQAPYHQLRVLITSRIVGYPGSPFREGSAEELELLAFDPPHIEAFAGVWFAGKGAGRPFLDLLRAQHQIQGLARIPLMLTLLCKTFQETKAGEPFPTRRVELYERCLKGLLLFWKQEKDAKDTDPGYVEKLLPLLAAVAYRLFDEGYEQFPESLLRARLRPLLEALPTDHVVRRRARQEAKLAFLKSRYGRNEMVKASEILDELETMMDGEVDESHGIVAELKRDGLLVPANGNEDPSLFFLHRTFHEYLAANHLARIGVPDGCPWADIAPIVSRKAWLSEWREVIVLLAGLLEDPGPLLEMLGNPKRTRLNPYGDDLFHHRLVLACVCIAAIDVSLQDRHTELLDRLTSEAFALWRKYCSQGLDAFAEEFLPALRFPAPSAARWRERHVKRVLRSLRDADINVRRVAARTSGTFGAADPSAVIPALQEALRDADRDVRWSAVRALGTMGAAEPSAVIPVLQEALRAVNADDRRGAVKALSAVGAADPSAVIPALLEALRDADAYVRDSAAEALGEVGAAEPSAVIPALQKALRDAEKHERLRAAEALGEVGTAASSAQILTLPDVNAYVRRSAVRALGTFGAADPSAVIPALLEALRDADAYVRNSAAEALGAVGAADPSAVIPALLEALRNADEDVRGNAARALGTVGAADPSLVIPALREALRDADEDVLGNVAKALGTFGAVTLVEVIPVLREDLPNADEYVLGNKAKALPTVVAVGPSAVIPALRELLQDADLIVRLRAVQVLGAVGAADPSGVIPALREALRNADRNVRRNAAQALGAVGAADPSAVIPALIEEGLRDADSAVRWAATEALGTVGAVALSGIIPSLREALRDTDDQVRRSSANALCRLQSRGLRIISLNQSWELRNVSFLAEDPTQS